MADWDANSRRLLENLTRVLKEARDQARSPVLPGREEARHWHAVIMDGLSVSPPGNASWIGRYRGEEGMENIAVRIGTAWGVHPNEVDSELIIFEERLHAAIKLLDDRVATQGWPANETLEEVLELMSWAHGEWARIHPFANGNGRIARLWANWIAMRYGVPPFVRLRPRPEGTSYADAAAASMRGNFEAMVPVFRDMLEEFLEGSP